LTPGPDPGPKEQRRILPESTAVIRYGPTSGTWQHQWERPVPYTNHSTAQLIGY